MDSAKMTEVNEAFYEALDAVCNKFGYDLTRSEGEFRGGLLTLKINILTNTQPQTARLLERCDKVGFDPVMEIAGSSGVVWKMIDYEPKRKNKYLCENQSGERVWFPDSLIDLAAAVHYANKSASA